MCWSYLNNRKWAILVGGIFIGSFITNIALFAINTQLVTSRITTIHMQFVLAAFASLVLAYAFLKYAQEGHREKQKRRRKSK